MLKAQGSGLRAQGLELRAQGTRQNVNCSGFLTTHAIQIVHHARKYDPPPGPENATQVCHEVSHDRSRCPSGSNRLSLFRFLVQIRAPQGASPLSAPKARR